MCVLGGRAHFEVFLLCRLLFVFVLMPSPGPFSESPCGGGDAVSGPPGAASSMTSGGAATRLPGRRQRTAGAVMRSSGRARPEQPTAPGGGFWIRSLCKIFGNFRKKTGNLLGNALLRPLLVGVFPTPTRCQGRVQRRAGWRH